MTGPSSPRDDYAWCTPVGLPEELLDFGGSVEGSLGIGAAGKVGVLDLVLAPSAGMTRVVRQYQRAPMYVFRPIYLDAGQPSMAFVYLQQQGDGMVQGDRHRVDIECAPGAAAHVTTQASTKVFAARQNFATQLVNLRVGAGAVLEYLPDPVVPFRGARLFQRTCLTIDPEATVIMGETLLPGRVAHGEAHAYDFYWAETEVRSPEGTLLFADMLRMRPNDGEHPKSPGMLGAYDVVAALYVLTPRISPSDLVAELRAALADDSDVLAGVSELPNSCGAAVRLLGSDSKSVQERVRTVWNAVRLRLLGTPAPDLRKG